MGVAPICRSASARALTSLRRRGPCAGARKARLAVMAQRSWFGVPDDARIPEALEFVRAALERTQTVGRRLVGLNFRDANDLATQSGCQVRIVKRDGQGLPVTADLATNRINIETEGDIVVAASPG